ncbi:MAG TPA: hypothetical protein VKK79_03780 [Candidatus Lokiarchaeia archaeon]|nr:hypothetical protein [Candidatus Lokiarchaeia archaeon]
MPTKEEKVARVIQFLKDGLSNLEEIFENSTKAIKDFSKSLEKAEKDLSGIKVKLPKSTSSASEEAEGEAKESNKKQVAADRLVGLLMGGKSEEGEAAGDGEVASAAAEEDAGPSFTKPPKGPKGPKGPPKGPPSGPPGLPKGPPSGPPSKPSGPPPPGPKLPPGPPSKGPPSKPPSGPPSAPPGPRLPPSKPGSGMPAPPPGPPSSPGGTPAPGTPGAPGFNMLRDEMLKELKRLKTIMRGT